MIRRMIVGLAVLSASMLYAGSYSGGTGADATNAYLIANLNDLLEISSTSADWGAYFKQTADIDASSTNGMNGGLGFSSIGNNSTKFTGTYDGQNHTISSLTIDRSSNYTNSLSDYIGLFGKAAGASVSNLGLLNVNIKGDAWTGGLIGDYDNTSTNLITISNCFVTGSVFSNNWKVGGLIGDIESAYLTLEDCYSTATVTGQNYTGGLVGLTERSGGTIQDCYATGSVSGKFDVGGLVGHSSKTINRCFSTGHVTGQDPDPEMGDPITYGGLVGTNNGTVTNSFWDTQTSGQASSAAGIGKTTSQMKTQSTFTDAGWDFSTPVWKIDASLNSGYPYLAWAETVDSSLPVELALFEGFSSEGSVQLHWVTESEIENLGFIIQRKSTVGAPSEWIEISSYIDNKSLEGHGSTTAKNEYQYTDKSVQPGATYKYRLGDVDYIGKVTLHKTVEITVKTGDAQIATTFGLQKAYPNPFNPITTIAYELPQTSNVTVKIFDVGGRLVETLINQHQNAGNYRVQWNASGYNSGVYFYRIEAGNFQQVRKMLLIK